MTVSRLILAMTTFHSDKNYRGVTAMSISKVLDLLGKRKLEVQHMINAIAEVTNIPLGDLVYMEDEEIESKYTAYVINEATEYAK